MKFWKIAVLLMVLVLVLAGCGNQFADDGQPDPTQVPDPTAMPPEATSVPDPTQVPSADPTQVPDPTAVPPTDGDGPTNPPNGVRMEARDLGPWAPTNGMGETFEVTSSAGDSEGVVLGLWWPHGNTPWGNREVTTFVEPGLSIEVQAGAGRGWDYPAGYSKVAIEAEMADHMSRRVEDTSYHDYIDVDQLVELGLVDVRFDRCGKAQAELVAQPADEAPKAQPTAKSPSVKPPVTQVCEAKRVGDSDNLATVKAKTDEVLSVEAWGGKLGDAFVVIPAGESVARSWQGGAIWSYSCTDTKAVLADVSGRGKPVKLVEEGALTDPS